MRITTLIENLVYQKNLIAEHGLSFCIEHDGKTILFDTGQSANFIHNANILDIDITKVEILVISHGHYDHIGGLPAFLKINNKARIYIKKQAFYPKYKNQEFIGLTDNGLLPNERFEFIESTCEIADGLFIIPEIKNYYEIDNHKKNFYTQSPEKLLPDNFNDELFLCYRNGDEITVISSCSHNGITNMIETAKNQFRTNIINVIGGYHTKDSSEKEMHHIISYINNNPIRTIWVCHCTGIDNYAKLQSNCKAEIKYISTGNKLKLT